MAVAIAQPPAETSTSISSTSTSTSAAVFKRLHPAQYLSRFLAKDYRPDGRKIRGWREVSINLGQSAFIISTTLCTCVLVVSIINADSQLRLHIYCEWFGSRQDG